MNPLSYSYKWRLVGELVANPEPAPETETTKGAAAVTVDPPPWFSAWVSDGVARVMIYDRISEYRLEEMVSVLRSCDVVEFFIHNCPGGESDAAKRITGELGHKHVLARISGFCDSATLLILAFSTKVIAERDASFSLHCTSAVLEPGNMQPVGDLIAEAGARMDAYFLALSRRMENAQRLLFEAEGPGVVSPTRCLSAREAWEQNLVDQIC